MKTYSYLIIAGTKDRDISYIVEAADSDEALRTAKPYIKEQKLTGERIKKWTIIREDD